MEWSWKFIIVWGSILLSLRITQQAADGALGGVATQSSVPDSNHPPSLAIDGNPDDSSCSLTGYENNPWWRLDLGDTYPISFIEVTQRSDCCSSELNGTEIRIGNLLVNNGNTNFRCASIKEASAVMTFYCDQFKGRYVNIYLPGVNKRLQLCEVKVYPPSKAITANVALGGVAKQSSVSYVNPQPSLAIDGKPDASSCTTTGNQITPWWRVDLGGPFLISFVEITRATGSELNGAEIQIMNNNSYSRCAVIQMSNSDVMTFYCGQMSGQFVTIRFPGHNKRLDLCEVKVYGTSKAAGANVALGGEATQSTVSDVSHPPSLAIDGKPDTYYEDFSCSSTQTQDNPWWRVDLGGPYHISFVHVMRRTDCCYNELNGAEIRIGYSLRDNGNSNPRCAVITVTSDAVMAFRCNQMSGRYVNIYLPGENKRLVLCEVKVYGAYQATGANVALGGEATLSTVWLYSAPSFAVDGKLDSSFYEGSCSHTEFEDNPWWRVDLGDTYDISVIEVIRRTDCCSSELNGAEIRIGHSLENNGNNNPRCAVITVTSEVVMAFRCNQMSGRYVNVYLPGKNGILALCEMKAYPAIKAKADLKKTTVLRFSTHADVSVPDVQQQILSQMKAEMEKKGISDFKIHWKRSLKQETDSKTTECQLEEDETWDNMDMPVFWG